ncbi:MAG: hypothetical protein QOH21_264 [Acidobacteriota bacterium]|nr:hypothetical protein [Acidobacteriota bacterium]
MLAAAPLYAQSGSDIEFQPGITPAQFTQFSRLVAQGIYATPVEPARARGLFGFDVGVAATAVPVDPNAAYWTRSVSDDFTISDHVVIPRLVASKGLSFLTISAAYAKVPDTDITMIGGSIDVPLIKGGLLKPNLALRGAYSQLQGSDVYDLKTYGVELFLSKGIGPITPYAAVGRMKLDAEGRINISNAPAIILKDNSSMNRYTVGVRISLLLPKLVIEATQAEERSYAAKVSFGL